MKILWLVHLEPDYGESMFYDGLCRTLGDENVVDFPYKYTHHGQQERTQNQNVQDYLDTSSGDRPYWAGTHGRPKKSGPIPFDWEANHKGIDYSYADILNMVNSRHFDLIVLAHPRAVAVWFLERLFKDIGDVHQKAPVVMCDFEDYHEIRHDILRKFGINLSFKLAYMQNKPNVYGLPFCSPCIDNPKYRFDDSHKTVDVTVRWGITHPLRVKVLKEIRSVQGIVKTEGGLSHREYMKEIAMSRIGIAMGGFTNLNRTAVKYWEIPSYRTLMICENPRINYAHPFENGKHCVFFDPKTVGDAKQKIEYYINHDKERKAIAEAGHEHLKKYHTPIARAKYFLEICMKHYPQLRGG